MVVMAKILKKQIKDYPSQYWFYCEGCDCLHAFGEGWTFNKD